MMSACRLLFLIAVVAALPGTALLGAEVSKLSLGFREVPREGREGRTTPKLDINHAQLGPVCELQCYETGPFQTGDAVQKDDGSVVFSYKSGNMTCTTTCTVVDDERVQALTEIKGPADELKAVRYLGACLQFQRSPLFTRQGPLQEFAQRCFIYTMRGPVMGLDTARGRMTNFEAGGPENNPPMVQWYLPIDRQHPGDVWGVVGTAGDRAIVGMEACTSRDGEWVAGYAARYNLSIGQLYMPCIHVVPDVQQHFDEQTGTIHYREMVYVMHNDPKGLLEAFRKDFPPAPVPFQVRLRGGSVVLEPSAEGVPPLTLLVQPDGDDDFGVDVTRSWWGAFIRDGGDWRSWVYPHDDALELCASLKADAWDPRTHRAVAGLSGEGWLSVAAPEESAIQVLRTADDKWTALLFWERNDPGEPALGVPAADQPDPGVVSVRGKIILGETATLDPVQLKEWADTDWEHAKPYRMPVAE